MFAVATILAMFIMMIIIAIVSIWSVGVDFYNFFQYREHSLLSFALQLDFDIENEEPKGAACCFGLLLQNNTIEYRIQ